MTGPGRPAIGDRTTVHLSPDTLELVRWVQIHYGLRQAEALRYALDMGLRTIAGRVNGAPEDASRAVSDRCSYEPWEHYASPTSPCMAPDWRPGDAPDE